MPLGIFGARHRDSAIIVTDAFYTRWRNQDVVCGARGSYGTAATLSRPLIVSALIDKTTSEEKNSAHG